MRSRKNFPLLLLIFSPILVCCKDSPKDDAVFWMQLDVTATHEHYYKAGDPETTVNYATDISFTLSGYYTITRIKVGSKVNYMALPGMGASGRPLTVTGLSVIQSHPCQDGQSLLIGRETRSIPANIHTGAIGLSAEPAGGDKVRIRLSPIEVEVEPLSCNNPDCHNGFGFEYGDNIVGWDREATEVDEDGYEADLGYVLTEMAFKTLQEVGAGVGELALAIPISIERVWSDEQDTPTGPERRVFYVNVNGSFAAVPDGE